MWKKTTRLEYLYPVRMVYTFMILKTPVYFMRRTRNKNNNNSDQGSNLCDLENNKN